MADLLRGEFRLGKRVGVGAEGEVYEAVSAKSGKKVAVKFIRNSSGNRALLDSLLDAKGRSPASCAAILDAFIEDERLCVVSEFVDGAALSVLLREKRSPGESRNLALALIDAAAVLHAGGMAHGDLSPDNVFVAPGGTVKFLDPRISATAVKGLVLGTTNYAAPEMLSSGAVPNPRGDVFSLAALAYGLFEGRDPFGCESAEEYVFKAGARSLSVRPFLKTPPDFRTAISAGLALDPGARPGSAADLRELAAPRLRRRLQARAIGGLLFAALLFAGGWRWLSRGAATIDSIAILPFVNENGGPELDYLSEGLTESLINELTRIPGLRVLPRTTVYALKERAADPIGAARSLNASAVVVGRLNRRDDGLTVSIELLDARAGKQLWGDRIDGKTLEALEVQRDLSRKIVANVRAKIGGDSGKPSKRGTDSPEAYQAYLKGRYFWNRRTAENIVKALRLFQEAAAADTSYALAYIGIADCYEVLEQYAGVPASESLPQARAAAQRALEIDAASSEAHASMGYVDMLSWRFDDSAKEFRRSIELDPNYASAHLWYGTLLDVMDRREEAATETHRAQELDPLSPITGTLACNIDLLRGRTDLAVEECRKVLELDDRFARAHDVLGLAYIKRGQSREGLAELEKAVALSGRGSQELGFLGYGYGATGRRSDAEAVLGELRRRYDRRRSPGLFLAAVCLGLGDTNQAFAWLEKDFQAHSGLMIYVPHSPVFERLRNEPRYKDLLRRLGL